jgi:predicted GTPase
VLRVLDANAPGKKTDVETLDALAAWFRTQNQLKPPPIVGVVSKIDGLSPVMEWSPPYEWEKPTRPKEKTIHAALEYVKQTFGDRLDSIVPVCTARDQGRVYGIEEFLLPTITLLLDEARAVSLVRSIHRDYDQSRAWQVVDQLVSAGMKIRDYAPEFAKQQLDMGIQSILKTVKRSK